MIDMPEEQVPVEQIAAMMAAASAANDEAGAAASDNPYQENLAQKLTEEQIKTIGATVVEDYDIDLSSRSDWDAERKTWLKLFAGYRDPKSFPWENCSNVHIPLLGIACLQFQARAYEALLPPKEYAKCWSTDGKTVEQAARAGRYMNWQLTEQMEEWEEDMDVTLLLLPLNGSAYKKTYYDSALGRPSSRVIGVENFVTPYKCKRIEDAPRKTHAFDMSLNDLRVRMQKGIFINADFQTGDNRQHTPSPEYTEQADKIVGVEQGAERDSKTRLVLEQHRGWDLNGDGIDENYIITVDYESQKVLRIETRDYVDLQDGKQKVMQYFTGYTFIPNPESHYGYGFGHLIKGLNESANTLINQLIDAGTLANTQSGFVNVRSGLKTGNIKVSPGRYEQVTINADDIRKAIYTLEFKEPSAALFQLLGLLNSYAKEISSVTEAMMGKLPPSDTTATTMLAVMEQGLKVFSTIHKRLHRAFRKELKKIFLLNSLYLDEMVYFMVQDETSSDMKDYQTGKADFANSVNIIPVSDPTITSRAEKLIKARQAYEVGIGNPLVNQDSEAMYELTKTFYEAIEVQNVEKIIKKPQPQTPPDLPPAEEEAGWLREVDAQVLPQQNHAAHMQSHQIFMQSRWAGNLTPQGKKLADMHMKNTLAMLYLEQKQEEEEMAQIAAEIGGMNVQPGGMEGMAPTSAYQRAIARIGPKSPGA